MFACSFQILYQSDATNQELFGKTVQPLLDLFIAGFNTCILVYGQSGMFYSLCNQYILHRLLFNYRIFFNLFEPRNCNAWGVLNRSNKSICTCF